MLNFLMVLFLSKIDTDKSGSKSSSPSVGKHTLARLFHSSDEMGDMRKRIESTFHCEKIEASRSYQPFSTQVLTLFHAELYPVADLEGDAPSSGIRPPADPKGPPLYYFEISIFADGANLY